MNEMKRFFECLVPTSICNLKCEYCYIIQEERRKMELIEFDYSTEEMIESLTIERLGGACYFSICGTGETLLQPRLIELVHGLLSLGHYVNITTNGTLTEQYKKFSKFDSQLLKRLHISFSYHYLELKKRNLIQQFFSNVTYMRTLGCSCLVQVNLYDGYIPYIDEIKETCLTNYKAYPQLALTRNELAKNGIDILSEHSFNEYRQIGKCFDSPLFDFTCKNFNVKRKEFCYAGDWSFTLDLKTGVLKKCYHSANITNQCIFDNPNKPIVFEAIGKHCESPYCINSSHFLSLGVIPELNTPTYADLRNRKMADWYNETMSFYLNQKLSDANSEYSTTKKLYINAKNQIIHTLRKIKRFIVKMTGKN